MNEKARIARRTLLIGAGGVALARFALAQRRPPVLGVLNDTGANAGPTMIGLLRGLSRHEFISNQTVLLLFREIGDYREAPAAATDAINRGAAALVCLAAPNAALAAIAATKTLPIIFGCAGDPGRLGLVENLDAPGGNVTGVAFETPATLKARAQLLKGLASAGSKLGVLVNPANAAVKLTLEDYAAFAPGREFITLEADSEAAVDAAFASAASAGVGAIAIAEDSKLTRLRDRIIAAAARVKIPTVHPSRDDIAAGGLVSHGDIRLEQMIRIGDYAGRILKGEKPAAMAVARPAKFETTVNASAAAALGLDPAAPAFAGADILR